PPAVAARGPLPPSRNSISSGPAAPPHRTTSMSRGLAVSMRCAGIVRPCRSSTRPAPIASARQSKGLDPDAPAMRFAASRASMVNPKAAGPACAGTRMSTVVICEKYNIIVNLANGDLLRRWSLWTLVHGGHLDMSWRIGRIFLVAASALFGAVLIAGLLVWHALTPPTPLSPVASAFTLRDMVVVNPGAGRRAYQAL